MIDTRMLRRSGLALALGLSLAACAQQSPPPAQQTGGMSGMGSQGQGTQGMSGMQGHNMSGMNMQQMMAHCAEMRQQARPGATMSADMQQMMAHCNQMDSQMGGMSGMQGGARSQGR